VSAEGGMREGIRLKFRLLASAARESMRIAQKFSRGLEEGGQIPGQIAALFGEGVEAALAYPPMAFDDTGRFLCDNVLYMCREREEEEALAAAADAYEVSFTIWMEMNLQEWTSSVQGDVQKAIAAAALVPARKVALGEPEPYSARRAAGPGDQDAPSAGVKLDVSILLPSARRAESVAARINDFGPLRPSSCSFSCSRSCSLGSLRPLRPTSLRASVSCVLLRAVLRAFARADLP